MEVFRVAGLALITVILTLLLKKQHPEYAVIAAVVGGVVVLLSVITDLAPVIEQIQNWFGAAIAGDSLAILLKAMGICFITQFAADTCKDAGESAMASKVELAGKVAVVLIALPLFRSIADTALSLTGGSL